MTARARRGLAGLVVIAAAGGCGARSRTIPCGQPVDPACLLVSDCLISWDDPRRDTTFCARSPAAPPKYAACGGYDVVTTAQVDGVTTYYFDASTGMLAAIVNASSASNATTCVAGPAAGFTLPICTGTVSEPLAACLDGGTDGLAGDAGPSP